MTTSIHKKICPVCKTPFTGQLPQRLCGSDICSDSYAEAVSKHPDQCTNQVLRSAGVIYRRKMRAVYGNHN